MPAAALPAFPLIDFLRGLWVMLAGIVTAISTSFKVELLEAKHNFTNPGDTFKLALFGAAATIVGTYDATTTQYVANADEVPNGGGYTTGGNAMVNTTPQASGTKAITTPQNVAWPNATFITSGCQGYNFSQGNRSWFVYNFGLDLSVVAGTLTVTMPVNDANNALLRLN